MKSRKKIKIEKQFRNRENNFKIEKNASESRNTLLQESRKILEFNDLEFNKPYRPINLFNKPIP